MTTKISEHQSSTSSIFSSVFTRVPPSLSVPPRFCQLYVPASRTFVTDVRCPIYPNLSARNLSTPNLSKSSALLNQVAGAHTNTTLLLHSKSLSLVEIKPRTAALHEPLCHRGTMTRYQALWKQMIQGVKTHERNGKALHIPPRM